VVALHGIVTAALLAGWPLAGCAPASPVAAPAAAPPPALGSGLLAFVPAPAEAVLVVDVSRLRGSPWAKPVLAWAAERERAGEGGRDGRGFDEMADVDLWLFARVGNAASGRGTLELARGRFDRRRLLDAFAARRPASRGTSFAGRAGATDADQALVLLDERTVAFGPPFAVQAAALARGANSGAGPRLPWLGGISAALDEEVEEAGGRGKVPVVELAFVVPEDARKELADALGSDVRIDGLGGRLFLDRQARALLVGLLPGRGDAQLLADGLSAQLRELSLRRSMRALGLGPVLGRAATTARDDRVVLGLRITERERTLVSDKLAAVAALLARGPAPPAPAP
jgi:hypothetical protein